MQDKRKKRIDSLRKIYGHKRNGLTHKHNQNLESQWKKNLLVKSVISILFIGLVYLLFQVQAPFAKQGQNFIIEAFTRDYNFKGVYEWYKDKFDGNPAIIPTFSLEEKNNNEVFDAMAPISRKATIKEGNQGIYLRSGQPEPIMAIAKGIVKTVGENESLGKIIIIKHINGIESVYGLLNSIEVKQDDWVEQGHIIGMGSNEIYFAIKSQSKYLNPMDVIPFD